MPAYEYAAGLAALGSCPPPCRPAGGKAFRLVHNPIRAKDFHPTALGLKEGEAVTTCGQWGVSLFTTAEAVQRTLGKTLGKYPHIANDVGDHIAAGILGAEHGDATVPSKSRHYNL